MEVPTIGYHKYGVYTFTADETQFYFYREILAGRLILHKVENLIVTLQWNTMEIQYFSVDEISVETRLVTKVNFLATFY